ncbi:MAG: hypothetical protein ACI9QQ_000805 [Myxococcota bacterium]|jgi:hypothetical protein
MFHFKPVELDHVIRPVSGVVRGSGDGSCLELAAEHLKPLATRARWTR